MNNDILIYDIECATKDGKPDPTTDVLKVFGCYSYKYNKYFYITGKKEMLKMITEHDILIGFNNFSYDNQVMYYNGFNNFIFNNKESHVCRFNKKINIDLMKVFKLRASAMKVKKGMLAELLMRYSLDYIAKTIGIVDDDTAKIKDFDYSVLNKDEWTEEEKQYIKDYLYRDLEITKKMYEWLENYFESFKDFVTKRDIDNKSYLSCSTAVFAYKAICKILNVPEEYNSNVIREESYDGGYVAIPAGERFEGNILLFDFSSLYPNLFIMGNLFGNNCKCCNENEKWDGDNFFKIKGKYCKKQLSSVANILKKFYLDRVEMKKNKDPREYSIKIIINSSYGAVSNPAFKHIYNITAAEDCTALARQFILYARKRFREEGYKNLMSDTDSIAVMVPDNKTKQDAQQLADNIVKELLSHMPFGW